MKIPFGSREELIKATKNGIVQSRSFGINELADWYESQISVIAELDEEGLKAYNRGLNQMNGVVPEEQIGLPVIAVPPRIAKLQTELRQLQEKHWHGK